MHAVEEEADTFRTEHGHQGMPVLRATSVAEVNQFAEIGETVLVFQDLQRDECWTSLLQPFFYFLHLSVVCVHS